MSLTKFQHLENELTLDWYLNQKGYTVLPAGQQGLDLVDLQTGESVVADDIKHSIGRYRIGLNGRRLSARFIVD